MAAKLHKVPPPAAEPDWEKLHAEAEVRRSLAEATGLEGRLLDATLDNYQPRTPRQAEALKGCRRFVHEFAPLVEPSPGKTNLLLLGPPGTGKTHLLAAVVREIEQVHAYWSRFTTPQRVLRRIRESWGRKRKPEDDEYEDITETEVLRNFGEEIDLLALDDLGASIGGDAELAMLGEVIDMRSVHRKAMAATSNLPLDDLRDAVGDRIYDRLLENCLVLVVDGPSYRSNPPA